MAGRPDSPAKDLKKPSGREMYEATFTHPEACADSR